MQKIYHLFFICLSLLLVAGCGSNSRSQTTAPDTTTVPDTDPSDTTSTPSGTAPGSATDTDTSDDTPGIQNTHASIDVLVLYDNSVQEGYSNVNTRINHLFAVTNNIYKDSQVNIAIHAKKILFFAAKNYPALDEIVDSASVHALREKHKADTVLLYQVNPGGETGLCGTAYTAHSYAETSHFKGAMFSQVAINCTSDTTAHEIGHNMGLLHSQKQDGSNAIPFSYGLGHGVDGQFATVMAYAHSFNTTNQVAKFSSPEYECMPGHPCGIAVGESGEAHATKVLELIAPKIANLY